MAPLPLSLLLTILGTSSVEVEEPVIVVPGQRVDSPLPGEFLAVCRGLVVTAEVTRTANGTVHASAACRAGLLVRGLAHVSSGPVAGARVRPSGAARGSPSGPLRVDLAVGADRGRIERVRLGSTGYRLVYRPRTGEPVTLYECQSTDAARWSLLWAGDLDRDGKLDFALDASDAFDRREIHLFLSRDAEEAVDLAAYAISAR